MSMYTDDVFRERIKQGDKQHGLVGFNRRGGVDYLQVVSWANGEVKIADFPLETVAPLVELIQHAMEHKTRPDEHSCYAFPVLHPFEDGEAGDESE